MYTYHTARHTLKATIFSQKNADMKAKYSINPAEYEEQHVGRRKSRRQNEGELENSFENAILSLTQLSTSYSIFARFKICLKAQRVRLLRYYQ